jgi:hypothetical protein
LNCLARLTIPPIIDILTAQIPRWHTFTSRRNRLLAYTLSQFFPQLYNPWEWRWQKSEYYS